MKRISLVGLVKVEFPIGDVRLCDGGFFVWGSETYRTIDATFGAIGTLEAVTVGTGDQVPSLEMTLLPPQEADISDLSRPGYQQSRTRFWLAEYDADTGEIDGTPDLLFDGQVDQTTFTIARDNRELSVTIVPSSERLFEANIGNSLSPSFQKSVWSGDTGHDNATGLGRPVAWGTDAPPANVTYNPSVSIPGWRGNAF